MVRGKRNTTTKNGADKEESSPNNAIKQPKETKPRILKKKAGTQLESETPNDTRRKRKSAACAIENEKETKEVDAKKSKVSSRSKASGGNKERKRITKVKTEEKVTVKKERTGKDDKKPGRQKTEKGLKQDVKSTVKSKSHSKFNLASHVCAKHVGPHVSITGGLYKAVDAAVFYGAKAFGMFLKSQRQWNAKPLLDKDAKKFKEAYQAAGFSPGDILPHGSYLMNCGSSNPETLQKSRDTLVDELQRCEKLGLTLYNFHPVIENMCCQGNTIGGKFQELKAIIDKVKDKSRIGVCLDTCHAFAAGHDLSSQSGFEKMMKEFESVVGFQYLKALHLNDSKGALGCHLDRHENIGLGHIGIEGFRRVMCDPRFNNMPMILETPPGSSDDFYTEEIKLLHSICKTSK